MAKALNLIGKKFNRLLVIERAENNKHYNTQWLCLCDCGNETKVTGSQLNSGKTQSCGCYGKERNIEAKTKHGLAKSIIYKKYRNMLNRCYNKNTEHFNYYGGRGITVCDRWRGKEGFITFLEDMGMPPEGKNYLDRIDSNGKYEPSNCRWVTQIIQTINKRSLSKEFGRIKGIYWRNSKQKWAATIAINGKNKHLGYFLNEKDAAITRYEAEDNHEYAEEYQRNRVQINDLFN